MFIKRKKIEAIKRFDKGESAAELAAEWGGGGVGKAIIVGDSKTKRAKIVYGFVQKHLLMFMTAKNRQCTNVSVFGKTDEALYLWLVAYTRKSKRNSIEVGHSYVNN